MRRRHAIVLMGGGVLALHSAPALARQPRWLPDGLGSVGRIGVLTPDFDPVPESEMWAMAPQGVSVHASRVPRVAGSGGSFADPPHVDLAAELLAGLAPRAIAYGYTGSSYAQGSGADDTFRARLEARTQGVPVILTAPAAVEALRVLRAQRVALIHPPWFTEQLDEKGKEYFRTQGFDVVYCGRMEPARRFTEVPPAEVYDWARTKVPRQADALFIGGNGLRAIGAIQALEGALGRPVLTANQVVFWKALRVARIPAPSPHYGRIFSIKAAQQ
jgi:maleate isomerase